MEWIKIQYNDIKGNAKWAFLAGPVWTAVLWAATKLLKMIPHIPLWAVYTIALVLSFGVFVWLVRIMRVSPQAPTSRAQTTATALTTTAAKFESSTFFAQAYKSSLTDEAQDNMRTAALAEFPNPKEREAFYLKFIGIVIQTAVYDNTWWLIYRSQLRLLNELNQRVLTVDEARVFFDDAAKEFPDEYAKENYDRWLDFLRQQLLIGQEGTRIAISPRGRDFLKYLIHTGRSEAAKRL